MSKLGSAHGLGRGLSALLGDIDEESASVRSESVNEGDLVSEISLNEIDTDAGQPRKQFDDETLKELAESIASVGVIQPIVLVRNGSRYKIVVGERRFRASRLAGRTTIPAIVRSWDEMTRLKTALIENLQRQDLNPVETAQGIRTLMDKCSLTQEEAASVVGKSRSAVANTLRLLNLPEEVLELLRSGKLSAGHARALVAISDPERQIKLARMAYQLGWSVRQLEKVCSEPEKKETKPVKVKKTSEVLSLEKMAREAFSVKAQIDGDQNKGKLVLSYSTPEDLQHIWEVLELINQSMQ